MIGMGFEPIPALGEDDAAKPSLLGQDVLALSRSAYSWFRDQLRTWPPPDVPEGASVAVKNRVFDHRLAEGFRDAYMARFQELYNAATARGSASEVLEKLYAGPTTTGDVDLFIRELRELGLRLNREDAVDRG